MLRLIFYLELYYSISFRFQAFAWAFSLVMSTIFHLYLTLDTISIYSESAAPLAQFFIFNGLVDLGPGLAYTHQANLPKHCINDFYYQSYTLTIISHNKFITSLLINLVLNYILDPSSSMMNL